MSAVLERRLRANSRGARTAARAVALALAVVFANPARAQDPMPPAPVQVGDVIAREVAAGRTFVGTVTAEKTSVVGSEVEGEVVELVARDGARVEQGAPLARLRTRPLELSLAAARADLDAARAQLAELENGTRPAELEQARSRLAAATAERVLRVWKLESARKMVETQQLAEDAYQSALADAERPKADESVAAAAVALLEEGPRKERIADAAARAAAVAARVASLEDDLERATIRAAFAG